MIADKLYLFHVAPINGTSVLIAQGGFRIFEDSKLCSQLTIMGCIETDSMSLAKTLLIVGKSCCKGHYS